jgi:hypothetical protein
MNTSEQPPFKRGEPASARETARYIADLAEGMAAMARGSGLDVMAYLLELVRLEAEEAAQNLPNR